MTKEKKNNPTFKVVVAGDSSTGKTSWLTRLTRRTFDAETKNTSGIAYSINAMKNVNYHMWDLAGRLEYRAMVHCACHDASGVFLMYDITNRTSFDSCVGWLREIYYSSDSKLKVMLIGNKTDLVQSRAVSTEEAQIFATENSLLFMETSALSGDHVESAFQQMIITVSDYDRQEIPFQVVLIDRKSAAKGQIHCVEKPLQGDLKFVALSYRWGELQESMVDTKLGYVATITSFRLEDFYRLCQMMEYDPQLKQMDYVWVDAICVDQANYERRKATVYHMSEIYKHANYILAVPDLHLQHLIDASINTRTIVRNNLVHAEYLYHLFQRDYERLYELDEVFLDGIGFPKSRSMRDWLTTRTDYLTNGFTVTRTHGIRYDPISALEHLCDSIFEACYSSRCNTKDGDACPLDMEYDTHYCSRMKCPLDDYLPLGRNPWKKVTKPENKNIRGQDSMAYMWSRWIIDRSTQILQGIELIMGLITDWSTRAWVVSEFNIAKKKNNFKYWFIQFSERDTLILNRLSYQKFVNSFYKFDLHGPLVLSSRRSLEGASDPICRRFHDLLVKQLKNQDFLERMLKSKASRNEDRFYAVLPNSPYEHLLKNRDVISSWNIQSMVSVKLKLYELLAYEDRLNLFFLSGHWNSLDLYPVSPTFATSTIYWQDDIVEYPPVYRSFTIEDNFITYGSSPIELIPPAGNSSSKYCLKVKPTVYHKLEAAAKSEYFDTEFPEYKLVCENLQIDNNSNNIDIVIIPHRRLPVIQDVGSCFYNCVSLIGNLAANKWEIHKLSLGQSSRPINPAEWQRYGFASEDAGFYIY